MDLQWEDYGVTVIHAIDLFVQFVQFLLPHKLNPHSLVDTHGHAHMYTHAYFWYQ